MAFTLIGFPKVFDLVSPVSTSDGLRGERWQTRGGQHLRLALLDLSCCVRSGEALRDRIKHLSDMISLSR